MLQTHAVREWMICAPFFRGRGMTGVQRSGCVVHGNKLGREIGIPTANIRLPSDEALAFGIYAVVVHWRGRAWAGAASWGTRPHFDDGAPLLEVHLLDFAGDLYGDHLTIDFIRYLRSEQCFASLQAMLDQIAQDIATTRRVTAPALAGQTVPARRGDTDTCGLGWMLEGGVFS